MNGKPIQGFPVRGRPIYGQRLGSPTFLSITHGGGWSPPAAGVWPTAFSPTVRGGVVNNFGVYADGGLRTVRSQTNFWKGIRTMSGITAGQKISCTCLIDGSTEEQGMGIINSSGTVESWAGFDANGYVLFFHVDQVYHNGGSIASLTSVTIGDRVRMDIDFDAATMRFYKQTGGAGAFVSMGSAIDISALGAGPWYPVSNLIDANGQQTWDFGQTAFAVESGFTRGPVGNWGWWNDTAIVAAMTDTWLGSDTTRMWELAASAGLTPDVVNNDPVGAWYGILYARLLEQSSSAFRPTYTTGGVVFDATGGSKTMADALSVAVDPAAPFTVLIYKTGVTGVGGPSGLATSTTSLSGGVPMQFGVKEAARVRATSTQLSAAHNRADSCTVVTYDGTKAYALDSDGAWSEVTVGTGSANITHIILRALVANLDVFTAKVFQVTAGSVTETQAKNLQWSARNVL